MSDNILNTQELADFIKEHKLKVEFEAQEQMWHVDIPKVCKHGTVYFHGCVAQTFEDAVGMAMAVIDQPPPCDTVPDAHPEALLDLLRVYVDKLETMDPNQLKESFRLLMEERVLDSAIDLDEEDSKLIN